MVRLLSHYFKPLSLHLLKQNECSYCLKTSTPTHYKSFELRAHNPSEQTPEWFTPVSSCLICFTWLQKEPLKPLLKNSLKVHPRASIYWHNNSIKQHHVPSNLQELKLLAQAPVNEEEPDSDELRGDTWIVLRWLETHSSHGCSVSQQPHRHWRRRNWHKQNKSWIIPERQNVGSNQSLTVNIYCMFHVEQST